VTTRPPRSCDACAKPFTGDATLLSVGGALRQRIQRAELRVGCSEAWLNWLHHYHASRSLAASTYRLSPESSRP
jgi:hypothetical protein